MSEIRHTTEITAGSFITPEAAHVAPLVLQAAAGQLAVMHTPEYAELTVNEWKHRADAEASARLEWLLSQPAEVVELATSPIHMPTLPEGTQFEDLSEARKQELREIEEAYLLQRFNMDFVTELTGADEAEAERIVTDPGRFVATVVSGIANSHIYENRVVERWDKVDIAHPAENKVFAVMRVEKPDEPEATAKMRVKHLSDDEIQNTVTTYHVESSLRDREPGSMFVLEMAEGKEPRVHRQRYVNRELVTEAITDQAERHKYIFAIMSDIASAFRNHDPSDDAQARKAIEQNRRISDSIRRRTSPRASSLVRLYQ